jgi:hypothetical protein
MPKGHLPDVLFSPFEDGGGFGEGSKAHYERFAAVVIFISAKRAYCDRV